MAEKSSHISRDAATGAVGNYDAADMEELRRLLVGSEGKQIEGLQERLTLLARMEDEGQVDALGEKLPHAIAYHNRDRSELVNALGPTIEETLSVSIRRNPQPFADAIFPAIGPAIRRSIAEALRSVIESMNRLMEHSFSMQSLRWRMEAARTGRSFSEVMLSHTLNYRVEQLFLIEKKSGILIQHLFAESVKVEDSDVVSSMLSAIQDFVRDSLGLARHDVLETIEIGEMTVMIEPGPDAILAAVVRGIPTSELRTTLKEIIEAIHLQYGHMLDSFDGDTEELRPVLPLMRAGLLEKYKRKEKDQRRVWILAGVLLVGLCIWLAFSVRNHMVWNNYIEALQNEPGIVVTSADWEGGNYIVEGLRDPLAADPEALLPASLSANKVSGNWEPYLALDSLIITKRAAHQLQAPAEVAFQLQDNVLLAEGEAAASWIVTARERAFFIPGISGYDDSGLRPAVPAELVAGIEALESVLIVFGQATMQLGAEQDASLDQAYQLIERIQALAETQGASIVIRLLGFSSTEGTADLNLALSTARAERVREALVARGVPADILEAVGTGGPRSPGVETTEAERRANRSVMFEVVQ